MIDLNAQYPALKLAGEIQVQCNEKKELIEQVQQKVTTLCKAFDDENNRTDAYYVYPKLEFLTTLYETWKTALISLTRNSELLFQHKVTIEPQVETLKKGKLSSEILDSVSFVNVTLGEQLRADCNQLDPKIKEIEEHLATVVALTVRISSEILHIEQHPLQRLSQTIERKRKGQQCATLASRLTDKWIRNVSIPPTVTLVAQNVTNFFQKFLRPTGE